LKSIGGVPGKNKMNLATYTPKKMMRIIIQKYVLEYNLPKKQNLLKKTVMTIKGMVKNNG
jgi:hypothetical protein